jgi:hypothetical protein
VQTDAVVGLVQRVAAAGHSSSRAEVVAAVADLGRLQAWCDSRELVLARAACAVSPAPESDLAIAGRQSARDADRAIVRARVGEQAPELCSAMAAGDVAAGHLDAFGAGLRSLPQSLQPDLIAQAGDLALVAGRTSPDEFARVVRRRVRGLLVDDGLDRLTRQRAATRLRTWVDRESGMWRLSGEFDPVTGVMINNRLHAELAALFAESTPDTCPADPSEKQDHLRGLAFAALCAAPRGSGARTVTRADVTLVFDTRDLDERGRPRVDWGLDVDIPTSVAVEMARRGRVRTVVLDNDEIVAAPGSLNLGRSSRVANAAPRRVLQIWYPTCAIPNCSVRYRHTKAHHLVWWRNGGGTDIDNLLPLCERHHHRVHDDGWLLRLAYDRTLSITYPDGSTRTAGPPGSRATSGHAARAP